MRLLSLPFLFLCPVFSGAVMLKGPPPPPPAPTLLQLTQKAGYIFSGTVLTIETVPLKSQNEVPTVRITFRIDQAARGVSSRQIFTIREWAGLWDTGERYRPGEQVMLFLYPSSRLGLTSPVNGSFGHLKLDSKGQVLLDAQRLSSMPVVNQPVNPISGKKILLSGRDLARAIRNEDER